MPKKNNRTRHEFLLTFFPEEERYAEVEVNGFHLVKQLNAQKLWEVAIYTRESYQKRKQFLQQSSGGNSML